MDEHRIGVHVRSVRVLRLTRVMVCAAACVVAVPALSGCSPRTGVGNGGNAGAEVAQGIPAPRHAMLTPYTLLRSHADLAAWVSRLPGYRWAVVLQEGQRAYVGAFPADVPPRADTDDNMVHGNNGVMSTDTQQRIRRQVMRALPGVRAVLITSDAASAAVLRGYADYVQSGGDMHPYMKQLHDRINQIWPNGKGVSADRPSASPDFGPLGAPANGQIPIGGHVRP